MRPMEQANCLCSGVLWMVGLLETLDVVEGIAADFARHQIVPSIDPLALE